METLSGLGQRIRLGRKAAGLTQEGLGERLGVGKAAVARWEGEVRVPGGEHFLALARALDVPLDWLVAGVGLPPEPAAKRTQRIAEERRSRLRQVLEGVEDLPGLAEKSGILHMSLMEALQSRPALTVDEVAKLAQALGISLSWLLWGIHGARFGAEPTTYPQPQFPEIPEEVIEDKRAYDELHPTSIRARYERLNGLIASQKSLGGLAKRAGVPEAAIHGYVHGKRTLTLSEVRSIARVCKSNMQWILTGESASAVEQVGGSLGNVASGLAGIVSLGFSAWLQERQRDGMVQGTMRYLKTKSLVSLLPADENHLDLTNDEVEARLSQILNPPGLADSGLLDWDSIDHARFILGIARVQRGEDREKYASLFRTAYQHAMEQSISGLPPDEDFIELLANKLGTSTPRDD